MAFRGGGGIRYNTENVGKFLDVVSTERSGFSGAGISLLSDGGAGKGDVAIDIWQNSADASTLSLHNDSTGGNAEFQVNGGGNLTIQANGVGAAGTLEIQQNQNAGALTIENNGTGDLTIRANNGQILGQVNAGGMLLEQFGGAAKIQFTPSTPNIDIVSAVELLLSANADVIIEGNGGANGKITLGTAAGGNGGVKMETPANGASPTFDVEVNAGTAKIQAGDGFATVHSSNTRIEDNAGIAGLYVQDGGGGHPVVEVCDDAAGFLGFFHKTPATQIPGSSITTLAQLVTALQNYGLLG